MSTEASECGCKHAKRVLSVASTEASEPLVALAEGEENLAFSCGPGGCPVDASASTAISCIRVERFKKNEGGAYEVEEKDVDLQDSFSEKMKRGPGCLPWVKIVRNGDRFRSCLEAARKMGQMTDSKNLYRLVKDFMIQEDQEVFYVIMLDTQLYVRGVSELARGARDRTLAPIPDVLRLPIIDGAMAFAVAHNHPSGRSKPSDADKELTKALKRASKEVDILFIDHIVVGADGYFSFKDSGLLK